VATVVDVDSPVYEPEAVWGDYLPSDVRAAARSAFSRRDGTVVVNGETVALPRFNRQAAFRPGMTPEQIGRIDPTDPPAPNPGAWDPLARLADMDALGIDHAIVLPTLFAEFLPAVADPALAVALARAYNDWAVDLAAAGAGRLHPAAVVALHDPEAAADEVARVEARGLRDGAIRPVFQHVEGHAPLPPFGGVGDVNPVGIFIDDAAFRPLWQSVADHGLVACVHPSLGVHNVAELIARAKSEPGMISCLLPEIRRLLISLIQRHVPDHAQGGGRDQNHQRIKEPLADLHRSVPERRGED
jgi:predicted TIM-barrel fold metal-dependent hydrolase